ncbi:MAG: transporter substrate-binding domain-containing protein [Phreatobacter sp.]|uniref:transporter substrate-binding domain-containing protein n=1 Tax=Phreatobacter sp. TaxID=1966341 RepID=UPI002735D50C|nr:transporter substrate-binding domain-containing protein [Phreatobacter sp.]MDP2803725.1 transporter substrate-binding domain-containing protein [Phreatobacter sp.]
MQMLFGMLALARAGCLVLFGVFFVSPAGAQSNSATGIPIRVAVYNVAPYAQVDSAGSIGGHSVRLWTMVASELQRPFELKPVNSVDAIFAGLNSGAYDVAIGALTVTPVREEQVDFSHATHPSGVAAAIRKPSGFANAVQALVSTIVELLPLFLLVAGLILIAGFATWRLERLAQRALQPSPTTISSFGEGVYWAAVTMTTVGYGDKTPKSTYARFLTVVWMFIGIVVISIFSGTVTAKLTATQLIALDGSETALRLARLGAASNSSGAEFLTVSNRPYRQFDTLDAALAALDAGEIDAVFNSRGALVHHVLGRYSNSIEVLHTDLTRGYMAFALPPATANKETLNRALLRVLNSRAWAAERESMAREYGTSGRADRTTF